MGKITVKELSRISGFSPATISRVLSGKGNVKEETRRAVEKLLTEHHYGENITNLHRSAYLNRTVLLIVSDLYNQFYASQIEELSGALRKEHYIPFTAQSRGDLLIEEEYVDFALTNHFSGIIFLNVTGRDELLARLAGGSLPIVFLNRTVKDAPYDSVMSDNYRGGYMATSYLIKNGHRRIAHLAGPIRSHTAQERLRGFTDAMTDRGLPVSSYNIAFGNLDRDSGYRFGEQLIKNALDVTAVFCGNDLMAYGLFQSFLHYELRVPEDISIICYDHSIITGYYHFTCVSSIPQKMSQKAAELLLRRLKDPDCAPQSCLFAPEIIPGQTVKRISSAE